jgi:hypothetical protein
MPEKPVCFETQQTTVSPHVVIAMYQEFRPDRRLAPWVECGWTRSGWATRSLLVMPGGCVDLFVSSRGDVMIAGPATTFYDLRLNKGCVLAGLRLRTGTATAVLGRPVSEFTDQQVLLYSILGVRDFLTAEKVLTATTPSQRVGGPAERVDQPSRRHRPVDRYRGHPSDRDDAAAPRPTGVQPGRPRRSQGTTAAPPV